jgi:very-short-patch-repair endonuclease
MSLPYDKRLIPHAKALRKNMTPQERKLWYEFLSKYPVRFQRQKVIDHYIADFYCSSAKLIIEIDGGGHYTEEKQRYDQKRTEVLESYGVHVLRFSNIDVIDNFEGVCFEIDKAAKSRTEASLMEGGGN